jgi:hypothetical protein
MPTPKAGSGSSKGQSFPYDHLFKLLMIGDAGVGKVRAHAFAQVVSPCEMDMLYRYVNLFFRFANDH